MKPLCKLFAYLLLCLFLFSCTPETDFVIPAEVSKTESGYETESGIFVIINKNSFKYHLDPDCIYVSRMSLENRLEITVPDTNYLKEHDYSGCSRCAGEK